MERRSVGVEHLRQYLQIITEISICKCSTLCAVTDRLPAVWNLSVNVRGLGRFGICR
ncbi:MAG: hypothetical protein ACKPCM_06820 [Pseudanabaena sp.]